MNPKGSRSLGALAALGVLACGAVALVPACSSSSDKGGGSGGAGGAAANCASPGGPESGPTNPRCDGDAGPVVQETGMCMTSEPDDAGADPGGADYGDTLYGSSGPDDDCKYDVSYTATAICENAGVTFTVTANKRTTGHDPLTGADPFIEAFSGTHLAPPSAQHTTETAPGVYQIGPILFDQPGEWTVRFHFFENCADAPEDSPHAHAAFFITVP